MAKRAHITLKTKLAAAICQLFAIPHNDAKAMSEAQILSLVAWDHYPILHAHGGPDVHWNLMARLILSHREKSKTDTTTVAKVRRIEDQWAAFTRRMAEKTEPDATTPRRRSAFPQGRKIRSRNDLQRRKSP
mgnify:CR=1 FL=1